MSERRGSRSERPTGLWFWACVCGVSPKYWGETVYFVSTLRILRIPFWERALWPVTRASPLVASRPSERGPTAPVYSARQRLTLSLLLSSQSVSFEADLALSVLLAMLMRDAPAIGWALPSDGL